MRAWAQDPGDEPYLVELRPVGSAPRVVVRTVDRQGAIDAGRRWQAILRSGGMAGEIVVINERTEDVVWRSGAASA